MKSRRLAIDRLARSESILGLQLDEVIGVIADQPEVGDQNWFAERPVLRTTRSILIQRSYLSDGFPRGPCETCGSAEHATCCRRCRRACSKKYEPFCSASCRDRPRNRTTICPSCDGDRRGCFDCDYWGHVTPRRATVLAKEHSAYLYQEFCEVWLFIAAFAKTASDAFEDSFAKLMAAIARRCRRCHAPAFWPCAPGSLVLLIDHVTGSPLVRSPVCWNRFLGTGLFSDCNLSSL